MNLSKSSALLMSLLAALFLITACSSDEGQMNGSDNANGMAATDMSTQDEGALDRARMDEERRQALVADLLGRARGAANEGRHEDAKGYYRQALDYEPTNTEASRGYASMVELLGGAKQDENFDAAVARQQERQSKAQFFFRRGIEARADGRLQDAVDDLDRAYQLLKFSESPLAIDLNADIVKRAYDETVELKRREDETRMQAEQDAIAQRNAVEEERERLELDRKLKALWESLLDNFEAERYERAERIADTILALDYKDQNAAQVKESARRARLALIEGENIANIREQTQRTFSEIKVAMLPPAGEVGFPNPRDWKKIADRGPIQISREQISEETERDRAVRERLAQTVLPKVDWNGKTLPEVIDELKTQVNVNIIATGEALTKAEDVGELAVEFTQFTAKDALDNVCSRLELAYTVEAGLVKVQTVEEARRNKVVEFYDVRDLVSPIRSFPGVKINLNASGVGGEEEADEFGDEEPNMAIDMDRLMEVIKTAVDPAWEEDEGNRLSPKAGTLIVRQTPEKQRLVRKLLNDLRKNTGIQVSIESRFITVENNFLQDIGVDLRGLGDDTAGVGVPGPGTSRTFDDFGQAGSGFGTSAVPTGLGTDNSSGVFFSDREGNYDVRSRAENLFDEQLGDPSRLDNSGGVSFQFAYLDDVQLEAILRAVQKYERINTVTAPRLMVYNTQRAHLTVLNEVAYVKDFDVEIAQAAVIADPIIDKVREGVVLDVRPIVSHDRRYVTLELRPTVATLVRPIRNFTTNLANGSAVTLQLPELQKQSVNTTVVVPDGGTLLLGGMKFAEEKTLDSGVPVLKDVPILGYFFSRNGKYTAMRDLIILLKVKIIVLPEMEPTADDPAELLSAR
ncbi:MAG: hypothetical protein H6807_05715 [Planctomycetes bacterium]|nr:hypothetical protein [Planctomycetota bacterium]